MLPGQYQGNGEMHYNAPMNHQQQNLQFPYPPDQNFFNPVPNRFIYVKNNFTAPTPRVLLNPHFRKTVYVNPQFKPLVKPKIHVNPQVLKNLNVAKDMPKNDQKPVQKEAPKTKTVISTKNKLVRVPCNTPETRKRRNSLHTKYKIVRTSGGASANKFKLDKRDKTLNRSIGKSAKKKYVYVNRFLSMDVIAKNVIFKKGLNTNTPGLVNINGIIYKKSPNSLRKAESSFKSSRSLTLKRNSLKVKSKYKLIRKEVKPNLSSINRKTVVKRYKLVRSQAVKPRVRLFSFTKSKKVQISPNKLRKCNIPCPIYRKYGKCPGRISGKCIKLHNPDQISTCTRFLQGACRNEQCLLSHKVSSEKMPTCKFFLEGLCSKDNCQYLHVKISPKADICRDFLEGFCKNGSECDKRHQFLCPDFEKNKRCLKRRCPYPHGDTVRKPKKNFNTVAKKCSPKKEKKKTLSVIDKEEKNRYYKDSKESEKGEKSIMKTGSRNRPKLGELPAFIPLFEET